MSVQTPAHDLTMIRSQVLCVAADGSGVPSASSSASATVTASSSAVSATSTGAGALSTGDDGNDGDDGDDGDDSGYIPFCDEL